ncbi:hypothetical protein GBAR_LOCUS25739 [Geodia barretti]|uniref:Uncharacterized protein n=2 Tax=Geodia barretti TaxID=519541 RepID=A0AA35TFE4_GEOBA|nr:hypothetical protein GBAR_LOCUS25739 [Geodia barretti]
MYNCLGAISKFSESRPHRRALFHCCDTEGSSLQCRLLPRGRKEHHQNSAHCWCLEQSQGPCPHTGTSSDGCWSVRS